MVLKLLVSSSWQIGGLTSSFVIGTSLFVIDGLENVADWRVVDIRQWTCVCVCSVKRQCYCQLMVCCFRIVSRAFSAIITFHNRSVYLTPSFHQSSYSFIMIAAFLTEIYSTIKILMMRIERDGDTEKNLLYSRRLLNWTGLVSRTLCVGQNEEWYDTLNHPIINILPVTCHLSSLFTVNRMSFILDFIPEFSISDSATFLPVLPVRFITSINS